MNIWQQQLPQNTWLVGVNGRLDQTLNPQLEFNLKELLEDGHYHLVVDLSQTTYINSGGLRALVGAWRKAKEHNGNLVLCGLNDRLQEIFSMVGFDKVFQIYPDTQMAQLALVGPKLET